jgi:predicted RNase H-like HicB family nuclease
MRFFTFEVVIEKRVGDDAYSAYSRNLHGCFARGATIEEARQNVRAAIQERVAELVATGATIEQADDVRYVEQLTIGVAGADQPRRQAMGMRGSGE